MGMELVSGLSLVSPLARPVFGLTQMVQRASLSQDGFRHQGFWEVGRTYYGLASLPTFGPLPNSLSFRWHHHVGTSCCEMTHARGYYHGLAKAGIFGQWSPNTFVDQTPNYSSPKALSSSLQKGMKEREWLSPAVIPLEYVQAAAAANHGTRKEPITGSWRHGLVLLCHLPISATVTLSTRPAQLKCVH